MLEFKFEKSNPFFREVMGCLLPMTTDKPINNIDEEIDKWFDELNSLEAGSYKGDILTTRRYLQWIDTFFCEKGCNKKVVGECMKEFCKAFGDHADYVYEQYEAVSDLFDNKKLTLYEYAKFRSLCNQKTTEFQMVLGKDIKIDEYYAIRALELFDEKFEWLTQYGFHSHWKVEFFVTISAVQAILAERQIENFSASAPPLEYQKKAQAFIDKYMKFMKYSNHFLEIFRKDI